MEITLPNSQGNQSFHSVAGKRSNGRAVYLGDPRLALLGRSPVGAEKSALTTPCPVACRFCVFWESAGPIAPSYNGPVMQNIAGDLQRAGGVVSGAVHDVASGAGDANPEVAKFLKGPGVNENTTIRGALQGAGEGFILGGPTGMIWGAAYGAGGVNEKATIRDTLEGAGKGAAIGFVTGGPAGALSGAISGGVEGFGQGVFDSNKALFEAKDPGRKLPSWAKPGTEFRVGYQAALPAAASTVVGDSSAASFLGADIDWSDVLINASESGAVGAALKLYPLQAYLFGGEYLSWYGLETTKGFGGYFAGTPPKSLDDQLADWMNGSTPPPSSTSTPQDPPNAYPPSSPLGDWNTGVDASQASESTGVY